MDAKEAEKGGESKRKGTGGAKLLLKMGTTLVSKHGAESSKNRALSRKPKFGQLPGQLLANLLEPSQPRAS